MRTHGKREGLIYKFLKMERKTAKLAKVIKK